jgi:D-glycero-alpha-D-manno-heptose-7-phosphate kinase
MPGIIIARAPTRLDFGGGWTDVPPYIEREGGAVCNIAITRYATATVTLDERTTFARRSDDPLVDAAIRRASLPHASVTVESNFPVGAGLGGSSAAGVAIAGALAVARGAPLLPHALAALSRTTEVDELGVPGGYQDHYAAAFGGALLLTLGADHVDVDRISLDARFQEALARRLVVVYTGESRISGETISAVRDAYVAGEARTVNALSRMKALAIEMAGALRERDVDTLGSLIAEHWTYQRSLHPAIPTARIDSIIALAAQSGAVGAKALGASGGGCVLAVAQEGREEELTRALGTHGELLDFTIDTSGFTVISRSMVSAGAT